MKKIIVLSIIIPLVFIACSENEIPEPEACFEMYKFEDFEYTLIDQGVTMESVYYKSCGKADVLAIFSGNPKNIYSDTLGVGEAMREDDYFPVRYRRSGDYEVTLVATNVDDYGNIKQTTVSKTVTVVDPAE